MILYNFKIEKLSERKYRAQFLTMEMDIDIGDDMITYSTGGIPVSAHLITNSSIPAIKAWFDFWSKEMV